MLLSFVLSVATLLHQDQEVLEVMYLYLEVLASMDMIQEIVVTGQLDMDRFRMKYSRCKPGFKRLPGWTFVDKLCGQ